MTFDEIVEEVYAITNRPDRVVETKIAIKSATLKAHATDFYSKDLFETGVQFNSTEYIHSLDLPLFISNARAIGYFRLMTEDKPGPFIEIIKANEVMDSYNLHKVNVAYVAGRMLEIRAEVKFSTAMLGCYVIPIVAEGRYSSWIAELYPYAIVMEAARKVFKTIGDSEQAKSYEALAAEEYAALKISAVSDVGY